MLSKGFEYLLLFRVLCKIMCLVWSEDALVSEKFRLIINTPMLCDLLVIKPEVDFQIPTIFRSFTGQYFANEHHDLIS